MSDAPELASPILATIAALQQSLVVTAAMGGTSRVHGVDIPKGRVASMPERCCVVAPAGGPGRSDTLPIGTYRVDVRCYGRNRLEAHTLALSVIHVLKRVKYGSISGHLVHWFNPSGGPVHYLEPPADWPVEVASFLMQLADEQVS